MNFDHTMSEKDRKTIKSRTFSTESAEAGVGPKVLDGFFGRSAKSRKRGAEVSAGENSRPRSVFQDVFKARVVPNHMESGVFPPVEISWARNGANCASVVCL
jgi:hypothetical protein